MQLNTTFYFFLIVGYQPIKKLGINQSYKRSIYFPYDLIFSRSLSLCLLLENVYNKIEKKRLTQIQKGTYLPNVPKFFGSVII